MGLDYSYVLRFRREQLKEILLENLPDLHNRLAPDKPYYRFPLGF